MDLFSPLVADDRLHPQFRALRDSDAHASARALINELYCRMGLPGKSFALHFQGAGFHSHLFEIACFAYLESAGLCPQRTHSSPDFLALCNGHSLAFEATTANPPFDQRADISLHRLEALSEEEIEYRANVEFPRRIGAILRKKLKRNYNNLPHCVGVPIILMVAPFFEPGSVYYTDESLLDCLYGITGESPGFFLQEEATSISAILYCNSFTVPRFFRMAASLNGRSDLAAIREGMCYLPQPNGDLLLSEYRYRVGEPSSPPEFWSQGVTAFFNPNADVPVKQECLPSTSDFSVQQGYLTREVRGFHPLTSFMPIFAIEGKAASAA